MAKKRTEKSDVGIKDQLKVAGKMSDGFLAFQSLNGPVSAFLGDGKTLGTKIDKVLKDGDVAALGPDVVAAIESFKGDLSAALAVLNDHKEIVGK